MAMNYSDLVASKATAGSIANWYNYSRLDTANVLEEAQKLLYQYLRVREMRSSWTFNLAAGRSRIALPSDFLDPSGILKSVSHALQPDLKPQGFIEDARTFEEVASVTLGSGPFSTTINTKNILVASTAHDLTQGSIVTVADATAVGGLTLDEMAFPVITLDSDDSFTMQADSNATATEAAGGGASATYTASKLSEGYPDYWAIFEDHAQFDVAAAEAMRFRLPCYRMPPLLSASVETNFLTTRYPHLLRKACMAKAADMEKDTEEYNKHLREMVQLIGDVQKQDDLSYYGAMIATDTP